MGVRAGGKGGSARFGPQILPPSILVAPRCIVLRGSVPRFGPCPDAAMPLRGRRMPGKGQIPPSGGLPPGAGQNPGTGPFWRVRVLRMPAYPPC